MSKGEDTMSTEHKRAYIYTSTLLPEQALEGYSIDEQEEKCKAAIVSKGWTYMGTFSDPGVSGRTMEREGLQELIKLITAGRVDAVVIYKLDRLSRTQRDTMTLIEDVILANDITLMSLNETLDTSTPWGRAMIGILSSFNQMESENIQVRTSMGREAKAKLGGYSGGGTPLGYRSDNGYLVIVPEEAEAVRLVFQLRNDGCTLQGIADELNARGYLSKRGRPFRHSSIQAILNNEDMYRGKYHYGTVGETQGLHEAILKD
jgi:site-specific DNA recombinase